MRILACIVLLGLGATLAQAFPVAGKPMRLIVPYPAGGHSDHQARALARSLSESYGIPVVVENRPGASTLIATQETIRSAPDGHTLLCSNQVVAMLPHLHRTPPYDLMRDLTPITQASVSGLVLMASETLPARDLRAALDYARANPGRISYGTPGAGSLPHLSGILLSRLAGIRMEHVPYKGSAELVRDLMSGQLQLSFDMAQTAISSSASGRVRLLAAATGRRLAALPELPTLKESGIDIAADTWFGIFGPAGLPAPVVESLYSHILRALKDPATRQLLAMGGSEVTGMPPAEFTELVRQSSTRWGPEIRALGVRLD